MNYSKILDELKVYFGVKENEVLIIRSIIEKPLTADQICSFTNIPKGRIYDFLNRLVRMKLIEKAGSKPSKYTIKDFEGGIKKFLEIAREKEQLKEAEVRALLEDRDGEVILEPVKTREDHLRHNTMIFKEGQEFWVINREKAVPMFFYPKSDKDFLKVRTKMKKQRKLMLGFDRKVLNLKDVVHNAVESGKRFRNLVPKTAIDIFLKSYEAGFGKEKTINRILGIIKVCNKPSMHVRVLTVNLPFQIIISENRAYFLLKPTKKRLTPLGMVISEKDIIGEYIDFFNDIFATSTPIEDYLRAYLKRLGYKE